jgi:hypothetical protein
MNNMVNAIIVSIAEVGQRPRCGDNDAAVVSTRNYVGESRNAISDEGDARLGLSTTQVGYGPYHVTDERVIIPMLNVLEAEIRRKEDSCLVRAVLD